MGLKAERRRERVPLFTNDDTDQLAILAREIEQAVGAADPKRIGDTPVQTATEAYDAFMAEAKERATWVNIVALPGRAWRALLAEHPPRKDVTDEQGEVVESWPQDAQYGFNVDAISRPLLVGGATHPPSLDVAQFDSVTELEEFVDDLADPQFNKLVSAAVRLNTETGPDPKFSASSWLEVTSAVMSRSQAEEDSPASSDSPPKTESSSRLNG